MSDRDNWPDAEDSSGNAPEAIAPGQADFRTGSSVDPVRAPSDHSGSEHQQRLPRSESPSWHQAADHPQELEPMCLVGPLPGTERHLEKSDVYMPQSLAHEVPGYYEPNFPDPAHLSALNPQPEYYFGYGIGPHNEASLEAVKTWMDGSERRFDTFTIAEYRVWEDAQVQERALETILKTQGLEAAMNQAERLAVTNGFLDPSRADGRVFFMGDAPPDPFTTECERMMERKMQNDVKYSFDYNLFGSNTLVLEAHKTWNGPDGMERGDFILLDMRNGNGDGQTVQRFEAEVERLTRLQETIGLEGAMNEAEQMAVANGLLDGERSDSRLFTQGPPDPFVTLRERELAREAARETLPEYQVSAISANGASRLDVLKSWGDAEHERERLMIPQPDWAIAQANAQAAHDMMLGDNLQMAMTLVELAGIEAGAIDPERTDPRLFHQGPPDPFETIRGRDLAQSLSVGDADTEPSPPVMLESEASDYPTYRESRAEAARQLEDNASLEGAEWFEAMFTQSERQLLQPVHDTVNYAVVVQGADPWTLELAVEKYWQVPNGDLGINSVTLNTYDPEEGHEQAEQARHALLEVYEQQGLEAMMHQAELTAMENGWIDGNRTDTRLFTQGPPDRFETLAERLQGEINPYWNTSGEQIEAYPPRNEVEAANWELNRREVVDVDGEKLGQAMFCVVYPDGKERMPDFDTLPRAQVLEMAHFETPQAAEKFEQEFRGYLIPGLFDGSELAEAVALLEGMSGEWVQMEGREAKALVSAEQPPLVRDRADWHPYNSHAERDAQIALEGLHTEPINPVADQDGKGTAPTMEPQSPELDL